MIGLLLAILLFNLTAFTTNQRLTANQIVHIWVFTIAFQLSFDAFVEFKSHGYWYFGKEPDWQGLLAHTVLIPPVNMMFLNWYPFNRSLGRQVGYFTVWIFVILIYEMVAMLPEPWGFFYYGWWTLWHSLLLDPLLLIILLGYYRWICRLERKLTAT